MRNRAGNLAACLILALAAGLSVAAFGQTGGDFTFYFGVKGYDGSSWFGEPSALALDERSGLIYVADTKAGTVDAFSLQGVPKFQYGAKNNLKAPLGLAIDSDGRVYVSENEGGPIKIIDSRGSTTMLALPKDGDEETKAGRMTFDRDGNLYVVDRANCRVLVFGRDGAFKLKFGSPGDERGQFKVLQDVAVDRQGRIYALDAVGVPIRVFDMKGGYVRSIGARGEGQTEISFSAGLFIDRNDQIWVVDRAQHCLKVHDRSGAYLRTFGSYGLGEGSLFLPVDAAIDSFGRVYVLEMGARRMQVFSLKNPLEPFRP